ncbi:MAG: ribosome biogenesis GTP-binding protein YihA/YsxC [Xanthobacteraceae bacterium]
MNAAVNAAVERPGTFTAAEIEDGRRLFAGEWRFLCAAGSGASLPVMAGPELAFAGRSNVGKSSLINALTGRRALARTSNTPGRTQELIFFGGPAAAGSRLLLVDMPGYGYAAAAKNKISAWTQLVHGYVRGRTTLARVYLLLDARRGLMEADEQILAALDRSAVSYQIVLTKADHTTAVELAARLEMLNGELARRPAAYPGVLATSAHAGTGIVELRAAISRLLRTSTQLGVDAKNHG